MYFVIWQEGVKHGRVHSFEEFLASVVDHDGNERLWRRFRAAQDPIAVLDRWAAPVASDHVHLITSPPPGADRGLLWSRFAEVLGVPAESVDLPEAELNTSLGRTEVELLRRVNRRFPRKGQERAYREVVKRFYGAEVLGSLGAARDSDRIVLPVAWHQRVERAGRAQASALHDRGHHVLGNLDELRPDVTAEGSAAPAAAPDGSDVQQLLALSLDATGRLLEEIVRLREENGELRRPGAARPRRWRAIAGRIRGAR